MTVGIVVIVDRLIANAQRMLDDGTYGWPASRAGLERILADLEARSLGHPDLERLRRFIANRDEAWNASQPEGCRAEAERVKRALSE
jgi:hypothetical protein